MTQAALPAAAAEQALPLLRGRALEGVRVSLYAVGKCPWLPLKLYKLLHVVQKELTHAATQTAPMSELLHMQSCHQQLAAICMWLQPGCALDSNVVQRMCTWVSQAALSYSTKRPSSRQETSRGTHIGIVEDGRVLGWICQCSAARHCSCVLCGGCLKGLQEAAAAPLQAAATLASVLAACLVLCDGGLQHP